MSPARTSGRAFIACRFSHEARFEPLPDLRIEAASFSRGLLDEALPKLLGDPEKRKR
jgi:hypothetical protein